MLDRDRSQTFRDREVAFAAFVDDRLASQYRLAAVILGDSAEAQDATHDAFEVAWQHWGGLRDPARLDAWFGRILVNVCRDRLRRRRRTGLVDVSVELAAAVHGRDEVRATADRDEISRGFERLDADQRVVIVLRFYLDLTVDQIAERVGVPAGTVKSRLHYALRDLNQAITSGRDEEARR